MGGVYFWMELSKKRFNFPVICGIKFQQLNYTHTVVAFTKIYANILFATNGQVDATFLHSVSVTKLYSSVNVQHFSQVL